MYRKIIWILCVFVYIFWGKLITMWYYFWEPTEVEEKVTQWFDIRCKDIKETDYPTIFIPWIAASWYSEYGYEESKVKRWIPDPITHVYDTLFYTFKSNGYALRDVFYTNEFTIAIDENKDPKQSLYLFGYDWKKDSIKII